MSWFAFINLIPRVVIPFRALHFFPWRPGGSEVSMYFPTAWAKMATASCVHYQIEYVPRKSGVEADLLWRDVAKGEHVFGQCPHLHTIEPDICPHSKRVWQTEVQNWPRAHLKTLEMALRDKRLYPQHSGDFHVCVWVGFLRSMGEAHAKQKNTCLQKNNDNRPVACARAKFRGTCLP